MGFMTAAYCSEAGSTTAFSVKADEIAVCEALQIGGRGRRRQQFAGQRLGSWRWCTDRGFAGMTQHTPTETPTSATIAMRFFICECSPQGQLDALRKFRGVRCLS